MLRLAIDISRSNHHGALVDCLVPFRRLDAPQLVRHVGSTVLVYLPSGTQTQFIGTAMFAAILPQEPGSQQLVAHLTGLRGFAEPIEQPAYGRTDAVPWTTLPSALFETLLEAGGANGGLSEAGMRFVSAAEEMAAVPKLDTFKSLNDAVLRNYGHACAMTGASEASRARRLGPPDTFPIRPRPQGGPVHVTNCIALTPLAGEALSQGHLTITDDFRLVADLNRIDPELLAQLNPDGRLRVPRDETLQPARIHLAWHREQFFGV